jgi:hypothetical protein
MPGLKPPWWQIGPSESPPPDPREACEVCHDTGTVDGEPCYQCPHCPICHKLLSGHTGPCEESYV